MQLLVPHRWQVIADKFKVVDPGNIIRKVDFKFYKFYDLQINKKNGMVLNINHSIFLL
jgi:hypothetical protein